MKKRLLALDIGGSKTRIQLLDKLALEGNPYRNSEALALMAEAAMLGGAVAIRVNGVEDISAMRRELMPLS